MFHQACAFAHFPCSLSSAFGCSCDDTVYKLAKIEIYISILLMSSWLHCRKRLQLSSSFVFTLAEAIIRVHLPFMVDIWRVLVRTKSSAMVKLFRDCSLMWSSSFRRELSCIRAPAGMSSVLFTFFCHTRQISSDFVKFRHVSSGLVRSRLLVLFSTSREGKSSCVIFNG